MAHEKQKTKILGLAFACITPLSLLGGVALANNSSFAEEYPTSYSDPSLAEKLLDSHTFKINGTSQTTPLSGWTLIEDEGYTVSSTGMIIDITHSKLSDFYLDNNPGKLNPDLDSDNDILMINSSNSTTKATEPAKRGYMSNEFTLEENSYYKISVDAKATNDGREDILKAYGSIYIDGLKDGNGKDVQLAYEGFSGGNPDNSPWKTYDFYIATGSQAQNVKLKLFLGESRTKGSLGVVFFDDVKIEKFSQNLFMMNCIRDGYDFVDTNENADLNTKFLVDALTSGEQTLTSNYADANLDFEKDVTPNGLSAEWVIPNENQTLYGHAKIIDALASGTSFETTAGYKFVGNDFSYNNTQVLALYTTQNKKDSILVENTTPIVVPAHAILKINMKVKISSLTSGAFNVRLVEDGGKLYTYSGITKENTPLQEKLSTAFTEDESTKNLYTNDYTDFTFYVKGRDLYDSQVKLQLALGYGAEAEGCVFVDNITLDYASSANESNENFLNLQGDEESSYPDIKNAYFNDTEIEDKYSYPLKAKEWTLTQPEDEKNVAAGVVYLYDNETYNQMYAGKYAWATSNPGNPIPQINNSPNNVYMMYNGTPSYQSITSSSYTLNADSYYNLTFDYYNFNTNPEKDGQLTVEIKDENGIVLFNRKIATSFNQWNSRGNLPLSIDIHTALTSSHNITVTIHFGTEDDPMMGIAYIDNVAITSSDEETFNKSSYQIDLTDYFLNLDPEIALGQGMQDSTAYVFDNQGISTTVGGILNGQNNEHNVKFVDEKTNKTKNILAITSTTASQGTIQSNFPFSLSSSSYYKLTFYVKTKINQKPNAKFDDSAHKCAYGATVGFTNFDLAENLISQDDFTMYTILFKTGDSSVESKLQFTLNMDKHYEGSAYLTNISFTPSNEVEYKQAGTDENPNKETTFFAEYKTSDEDTTPPDTSTDSDNNEMDMQNWLIIPSLITALAVVVGIVGWALRHVKIKKIEKIRAENYVRKVVVDEDAIIAKASAERDRQAQEIKTNIENMQQQKLLLEEEHKLAIKDARLNNKGKITKETEHEFKSFASKITKLEQKIDILKEQLEKIESSDYLISLQRQISAQETKRQKEQLKKNIQQAKENEKQNNDKKGEE